MKVVQWLLSHLNIVLSLTLIVLLIFDYFNPYMEFLSNIGSRVFLLILCLSSASAAALALVKRKK